MKLLPLITLGLLPFLTSCNNSNPDVKSNYIESKPSFFELRNGDWLTNDWIRKPENMLMIHETFKKFGYLNLIGDLLVENPLILQDIFINKQGVNLIDSLVLTYKNRDIGTKYYREFWQRRETEKNDSAVFVILSDIQFSYKTKFTSGLLQLQVNSELVNDTLLKLLDIEFNSDTITKTVAIRRFEDLKQLGFHQSAYNLLFEYYKYQDIRWDKDSLEKTLRKADSYTYPWIIDDTK
jgi:hypothetical protein